MPNSDPRPNFFIVGAQRCGTTSLAIYLAEHPRIFITNPKEPYYFATDFPHQRRMTSEIDYLSLFRGSERDSIARGDATAGYLYSSEAIKNIFKFNKEAKIIVMLRNPVDLIRSVHANQLFSFEEDKADFSEAWALQERRLLGEAIPPNCRSPQFLQYRDLGMLGKQVARVCSIFPKNQVCFFLLDELASDPGAVYRQALAFLNIPNDGRENFSRFNEKRAHRFAWFFSILAPRPAWFQALIERVRGILGPRGWEKLVSVFIRKPRAFSIPASLRDEIEACYERDICLLSELTGKDLKSWRGGHFS